MNHFAVGLGSNTPDREQQIEAALKMLRAMFTDVVASNVYESRPQHIDEPRAPKAPAEPSAETAEAAEAAESPAPAPDGDGEPSYLNAVAVGITPLTQEALVQRFKNYERDCGRKPRSEEIKEVGTGRKHHHEVCIDLDLVIYNGRILRMRDFSRSYFNIGYRQLLADGAFQFALS